MSGKITPHISLFSSIQYHIYISFYQFIGVSSSSTSLKEVKKSSTTTTNTTPTNNTTSTSTSERNKSDHRNVLSELILDEIKHEGSKISNFNNFSNGKQTLDVTPVSLAISRHLGMDLTHESYKSGKFGIVILVNGALESIRRGKLFIFQLSICHKLVKYLVASNPHFLMLLIN